MSKIIRFHACDIGNENAFYPTWGFDLTKKDAEPHLLIHAANGTGKTTILSVIFSLFDPRTDFFLHHIVDNKRHFRDYFVQGQPHFAAAEILLPKDKRVVIGHYVYNKPGSGGADIERFWFLFEPQVGLEFDDLPFSGLASDSQAITTRQKAMEWRAQMRQDLPGIFIVKEQQSAWTALLDEHGIDRSLIASQVTFSQIEGGMEGWLKVVGEPDLIERFLKLAIPNDDRDEQGQALLTAYRNITDAVKGLKGLPFKRRHFETLSSVKNKIDDFVGLVATANADEAAYNAAHQNLRDIASEAQQLSDLLAVEIEALAETIRTGNETAKIEAALMKEARSKAATAARIIARFTLEAARKRHHQAQLDRRQAERNKAAGKAALAMSAVNGAERILNALKDQRDEITKASGNDVASLRLAGGRLHAALASEQRALEHKVELDRTINQQNSTRRKTLGAQRDAHLKSASSAELEARRLREDGQRATSSLEALKAKAVVRMEEHPEDALQRHASSKETIGRQIEKIDDSITVTQSAIIEAGRQIGNLDERIKHLTDLIEDHTRFIETGTDEKLKIMAQPAFVAQAGETTEIDPDDATVDAALRAELKSLGGALEAARKSFDEADSAIRFIEEKGYGRPNEDAARAADVLKAAGFWAVTAEGYLSENIPAVAKARSLIEADPAKFTGVFVQSDDLDDAQATLADLRLKNPVVLSPLATHGTSWPDRRTLQPFSAASFNKSAATEELEEWHRQARTAKSEIENRTSQIAAIEGTLRAIYHWSRDYGGGRLQQRILKKQGTEEERRIFIRQHEAAIATRASEQEKLNDLQARRREAEGALRAANRMAAEVEAWIMHQAPALAAAAQAPVKEAEAQQAAELAAERASEIDAIDAEILALTSTILENSSAARRLQKEAGLITHRDPAAQVGVAIDLEVLRADYQSRLENYDRTAGEKLTLLEGQIKMAAAKLTENQQEFTARRKDLSDEEIKAARMEGAADVIEAATLAHADAESRISATDREIGGAETELRGAERHEADMGSYPAGEHWSFEEAGDVKPAAIAEAARAENAAKAARQAASEATIAKARKDGEKKLVDTALARTRDDLGLDRLVSKPLTRPAETLPDAIDAAAKLLKGAETTMRRSKNKAGNAWESIQGIARGDAFREVEKALWVHFDTTTSEQAVIMADSIKALIEDRISSVSTELEQAEKDRRICLESMISIADQSANAIEAAVRSAHIPQESKRFSGMAIMKMRWKQDRLSQQEKSDHLSRLFDGWIQESPMPRDAWIFAAHCLLSCARWDGDRKSAPLGIELLRPKPENVGYATISEMKFSGGEGLTAAILVYLMIAQTRARSTSGMRRTGEAGVLILDNPIGQANRRDLIELQLYMASVAGLQLIYATGINDEESISPFPHLIRMAPVAKQMINGVEHVRVGSRNWLLDRDDDNATDAA
jgi:hypothetical protein